jgi:rhamnosyltransferase
MNVSTNIAVLLAAYNGRKWIEEQIKTIQNQKGVYFDLYISLDLSTDNTLDIVTKLTEQYPNIILLPYGQIFGSAAPNFYNLLINTPIENYDYIALSDQDDIWLADKLKKAIELLNFENASGYSSNVTAYWENGRKKLIKKAYLQCEYDYLFESPGPGCSFVFKKELALAVKKFIRSTSSLQGLDWHDWMIYAFARKNEYKWIIDSSSYVLYRQHTNNQLGANTGYKAFIKRMRDIISGYGINQTLRIINLFGLENDPFVIKRYKDGNIDYLKLEKKKKKCRRKMQDKLFFFFACALMLVLRPKIVKKY